MLTPFPFVSYRSYAINQFRVFAIKKGYITFSSVCGFFGCLLSLVDHYLIKKLFILKFKHWILKTNQLVYKNYNPYQIRPDTVDLVTDYCIFHHFFCCIIITRSTAIFTCIAIFKQRPSTQKFLRLNTTVTVHSVVFTSRAFLMIFSF